MANQTVERWRATHVGKKGDRVKIGGLPVWQREWRWLDQRTVRLPHPLRTTETFSFMICEIGAGGGVARFAAAQIEPNLWAFYIPD